MKCEPASKLSLVSGNYHEPAEPVVMVMASIDVKIRHVFADTPITEASIGAAPPGNSIAQWYRSPTRLRRRDILKIQDGGRKRAKSSSDLSNIGK